MKLNDEYRIEEDGPHWKLIYSKSRWDEKKGKEIVNERISYYGRFDQALNKFLDQQFKGVEDIESLREKIVELSSTVEDVFRNLEREFRKNK